MEIKITNYYQFCRNEQMKRGKKRELDQKRHICLSNVVDSDFACGYFYYAGRIGRILEKSGGGTPHPSPLVPPAAGEGVYIKNFSANKKR